MTKDKKDNIISYINKVADLYAKRHKAEENKDQAELETISKQLLDYKKNIGKRSATYADVEESFAYLVSTVAGLNTYYNKAVDSKLNILLNLLKQQNTISSSTYDSVMEQYKAINQDYHVDEGEKDGNTKVK